jgi:hypothetical protein
MSKLETFFFNGHGMSVPVNFRDGSNNIVPTKINLAPGQIVIMYNEMCSLRGSAWVQEIIFNDVVHSKNPQEFIENIRKIKPSETELFGYFGSLTNSEECPNLFLNTYYELFEKFKDPLFRRRTPYEDRFGLFHVPLTYDQNKFDRIKSPHLNPLNKIKIDTKDLYVEEDFDQYELINPSTVYNLAFPIFPIYPSTNYIDPAFTINADYFKSLYTHYDFLQLKEILDMFNDLPFILFMNVCRSTETINTYDTSLKIKRLELLQEEFLKTSLGVSAPAPAPAPAPAQVPTEPVKSKALPFTKNGKVVEMTRLPVVSGGSFDYKSKYLKYKRKYLELKKILNKI